MHRRQLVLGTVVLGVFALYASAARLVLIHDDAINAIWMNRYSLLSIFTADYAAAGASARPVSNALWILTRDLFGWYEAPVIHMWNVWFHTLNVVLVASLAVRLGRRFGLMGWMFPSLAALIFGLFPLSFQSVIWAGAIYHPVMLAFGLLAIHASLSAQSGQPSLWGVMVALLVVCYLSHEAGFLFGVLVLLIHTALNRAHKQRLPMGAWLAAASALVYIVLNRWLADTSGANAGSLRSLPEMWTNATYFMQAMVTWPVILLRPIIGLSESSALIILAVFVVCVVALLLAMARRRLFWLGALGVAWWALMASVPIAVLDNLYVATGPRLLYSASVGIAFLWSGAAAALMQWIRWPVGKAAVLAVCGVLLGWSVPYVVERIGEMERLTPAMRAISTDLSRTQDDAKVLFVNMPWWNAPSYPAFFIGAEGMPIFQHEGAPAWTWIAANSNVRRETSYVRHEPSLKQAEFARWNYGQPGDTVDDTGLQARMLAANAVYIFDYDPPGLRARRVALIEPAQTVPQTYVAMLEDGAARIYVTQAAARLCNGQIELDVGWQIEGGTPQPVGVFVHAIDAQGNEVLNADRNLLNGAMSLEQLPVDVALNELRMFALPTGTPAVAQISMGVYRRNDVTRLKGTQSNGAPVEGDQILVPVTAECSQ